MKVMKFGGGCLKDADGLNRVVNLIRSENNLPCVVVSAVAGVTDLLLQGLADVHRTKNAVGRTVACCRDVHLKLLEQTVADDCSRPEAARALNEEIDKAERILTGIALTGEATVAVRNLVLSFGERLAARLVSAALGAGGVDARHFDADAIGLLTDDNLENATADLKACRKSIGQEASVYRRDGLARISHHTRRIDNRVPLLRRSSAERNPLPQHCLFQAVAHRDEKCGLVPVITGFFGVTDRGRISLFGRNGSDYSAAVVAHAVGADELEIWKDVDGFMTADPKIIPQARKIDRLSYYEAAELSYFGAKILHPRTLEPLDGMEIAVRIKSLLDPGGSGTEIRSEGCENEDVVKSVTADDEIAVLRIHGPGVGYKPGVIGQIGRRLSDRGVNIHAIITAQTCINLLLDKKDARESHDALRGLDVGVMSRLDLEEDIMLIAVVGDGLLNRKGVAARIFSSISRAGVNVEMISTGASEAASYFIVRDSDGDKAIKALHREFFETSR